MSIKVVCQCGKRFVAPPGLAGKSVSCPSCGSPIVIAAPSAVPAQGASLRASPIAIATDNLWSDLPQQQGGPPHPEPSPLAASPHASLAHQYLADAHRQAEGNPEGADVREGRFYARIQRYVGMTMMACAALWFLVGIVMGDIYGLSLWMFFAGVVVLIIGIVRR